MAHSKKRTRYESPVRTGWPAGMLQDDDRRLSRWLASRGCARELAREAAIKEGKAMSEERETTLAILAGIVDRAQQRYHMLGMQNTHGLSAEDRAKLLMTYEIARAEYEKAQDILREAIRK
jgi:hypothetical protein